MFILIGFFLLLLLPWPWSGVSFIACVLIGAGELTFWSRRVRGWRVKTGAETMIGKHARVVQACRPDGQVAIAGELWQARCDAGADPDDTVTVVARKGLVLIVEPEPAQQAG